MQALVRLSPAIVRPFGNIRLPVVVNFLSARCCKSSTRWSFAKIRSVGHLYILVHPSPVNNVCPLWTLGGDISIVAAIDIKRVVEVNIPSKREQMIAFIDIMRGMIWIDRTWRWAESFMAGTGSDLKAG